MAQTKRGGVQVWSFRPNPHAMAMVEGLVASGEFSSRSQALNFLLERGLDNWGVEEEDEYVQEIQISSIAALKLGVLMKRILGEVDQGERVRLLGREILLTAEKLKRMKGEKGELEKMVDRRKKDLGRTRSPVLVAQFKSYLERDRSRIKKLDRLIDRAVSRQEKLVIEKEKLGGGQE